MRQDLHLSRVPPGQGMLLEAGSLHHVQDGVGNALLQGAVLCLQTGPRNEDRHGSALRAQAGLLHGHPLLPQSGLQASPGHGLLPGAFLLQLTE